MNRILIVVIVLFSLVFLSSIICFYGCPNRYNNRNRVTFQPELAMELTSASIIAYCHPEQIRKWKLGILEDYRSTVDISTIQYISQNDNFGYFVYSSKYNAIQIAFRGSININNWLDNMKMKQTNLNIDDCINCQIHTGFYNSYIRLKDQFDNVLLNYYIKKYSNATIQFTGHSLGGALATIFVAHTFQLFQNKTNKIDVLYTIGQPRVGNKQFAEWFDKKCEEYNIGDYQLSKFGDPIPFSIPQNLGYYHTGFNVYYMSVDKFYICEGDCAPEKGFIPQVIDHINYFGWNWKSLTIGTQCKKNEFNPREFKSSFIDN